MSVFGRPQGTTRGRIGNSAALILTVVVVGTIGYLILGLGVVDAVYQTIVTVSTVGFREIADGQPDTAWKVFTLLLILVGAGSMLYGATSVIESIVEGRISGQFWRFRMQRTIDDLSDHLILCGMGRVGRSIATFVRSVGQEVVVVDIDEERIVADDSLFLIGDATTNDVLRRAGIERAATLVVALGTTVDNLYVTLSARDLNPEVFIVSRADDPESIAKMHQVGADRVVNPYEIGGFRMASLATQPNVADFVDVVVHDGTFEAKLREIPVRDGSPFAGRTLDELEVRDRTGAVILTVRDDASTFHTDDLGGRPFATGDVIVAIGPDRCLDALADLATD